MIRKAGNVMRLVICDDIPKELEMIREALDAYTEKRPEYHFVIDEYSTAADVLSAVEKGQTYDIALLDICMPSVSGTDAAEEMLAKSPEMSVIFLTTSNEYAVTAFALNATHYLLKPFSQEQFNAALDRAVKKTEDQDILFLACVDGMYRVCISEIVFIESQSYCLQCRLFSGEMVRLRMKLSQMFEEIQKYPEFIRVGVSYIVNLVFVRRISGNTMEMQGGVLIPIPRRSSEEVQKTYMEFSRKEVLK